MEDRIKNYEKFIKKKMKEGAVSPKLVAYHREMVADFQHERLVHLIIMLFFVMLSLASLVFSGMVIGDLMAGGIGSNFMLGGLLPSLPIFILTIILVVLTMFYVKHYYFLENHVQELYDLSKEIEGV